MTAKISSSILAADFSRLGEEVIRAERGGTDMIHFDVMDGHFVPNITIGSRVVRCLREKTSLPFEIHLMIENPELYIRDFAQAGGNCTIIVNAEASKHLHRMVRLIRSCSVKTGLALNPTTPLWTLEYILNDLDEVLIMTVNPGFGGQEFIYPTLSKIEKLSSMIDSDGGTLISVDGGINSQTAPLVLKAGANILVAGSFIFKSVDIKKAISLLKGKEA